MRFVKLVSILILTSCYPDTIPYLQTHTATEAVRCLEQLAFEEEIPFIYKTCDTIEGLEESLNTLFYNDPNFIHYEIIYIVISGEGNNICLNEYYYSLEEIAELFEGKMKGKILHFSNTKVLDLSEEEAQYFLDITGARAVSGYEAVHKNLSSNIIDKTFFSLCQEQYNVIEIVEELYQKQYALCKLLDFRMYY